MLDGVGMCKFLGVCARLVVVVRPHQSRLAALFNRRYKWISNSPTRKTQMCTEGRNQIDRVETGRRKTTSYADLLNIRLKCAILQATFWDFDVAIGDGY